MSSVDYVRVNAIGATVISFITLLAAVYLLYSLAKQGRGKLRVRLLTGLVISDIALGILVIPPELSYVVGYPLVTGTPGCDAVGFLLTMILFTQHLWTLTIAFATFFLLKYPLSRATTLMERYSWTAFPLIWGVSALQSGIWYKYYGYISGGNLCNYAGDPDQLADPKDLVQFIPRAFVFVTILALYSKLFQFLRRPDAIQVSSYVPGGPVGMVSEERRGSVLQRISKKVKGDVKDDRPPWEQLEFVTMGTVAEGQASGLEVETSPALGESESNEPKSVPMAPSLTHASITSSLSPLRDWEQRGSDAETLVTPTFGPVTHVRIQGSRHTLSPVLSDGYGELSGPSQETKDQTMAEFFQEFQVGVTGTTVEHDGPQMSATEYFNRQASLLMLYFPLAYLLVFSVSLARLIYDMTSSGPPNAVLNLVSAWFVLSVGFIDGLVYGLAEYMVRRRVRRKMPDRL